MIHDWTQLFGVIAFFVAVLAVPGVIIFVLARLTSPSRGTNLPSILEESDDIIRKDEH